MGVDHHGSTTTHSVNAFTARWSRYAAWTPTATPAAPPPKPGPPTRSSAADPRPHRPDPHRARSFDPTTGRFLSIDPILAIADSQQINGYAYAHNNPITFTDPTGLFTSVNGVPCIDGDCSYHNRNGSLKTAAQCKAQQCGSGYGSSTASSQSGTSPLIPVEAWSDPCAAAPASDYCKVLAYIVDEMTITPLVQMFYLSSICGVSRPVPCRSSGFVSTTLVLTLSRQCPCGRALFVKIIANGTIKVLLGDVRDGSRGP